MPIRIDRQSFQNRFLKTKECFPLPVKKWHINVKYTQETIRNILWSRCLSECSPRHPFGNTYAGCPEVIRRAGSIDKDIFIDFGFLGYYVGE